MAPHVFSTTTDLEFFAIFGLLWLLCPAVIIERILFQYFFVAIVEMNSNEDLYQKLLENPLYPFNQWTVTPLVDLKTAIDEGKKLYQRMMGS